jgi:TOBE domain
MRIELRELQHRLGVTSPYVTRAEPTLLVRTVHLRLDAARPAGGVNVWPVTVRRSVFLGDLTELHVAWGGRGLVVRRSAGGDLDPGRSLHQRLSGTAITPCVPRETVLPRSVPNHSGNPAAFSASA